MKKMMLALAAVSALAVASPAMANYGSTTGGWSSSGGNCRSKCGSSSSGNTTSSSSGNQVPEPGMLGMAGAGLIGLALWRRRKGQTKAD